jgi:hypothetical protein
VRNGFGGGYECVRGCDHLVAGSNTGGQQSQVQRCGPGGYCCCAAGSHECCERVLEVGDFFTKDEAGVVDGTLNGPINLRLDAEVLCFEVDERYLNNSISLSGYQSGGVCR